MVIKPKRIKQGDTIGIIAPASPAYDAGRAALGIEVLRKLGFNVVLSENCSLKHGYLAGEDMTRAKDINDFFLNDCIDGIICLRGGYGTLRLLNLINYNIIRSNPKVFVGYSDITALHSSIHKNTGLITFHGPMVASDLADDIDFNNASLINSICGTKTYENYRLKYITQGDVSGILAGGNLSVLCSLMGSGYQEDLNNKILFLEDIGEKPYRIDRMLHQLKHSGIFSKIKGVILGQFTDCEADDPETSFSLDFVFRDFFKRLNIPVYYDIQAGHGLYKITLPLGTEIAITNNTLFFNEEGVI